MFKLGVYKRQMTITYVEVTTRNTKVDYSIRD